ncbi:MAG: hydroxyacylglutathione hydrolase [Myxococcales bacterium]|nr:hydroxyacylglutathione hydrolase [Myxococcales bacterium]
MHVVSQPREPFATASGAGRVHQVPAASDNLVWILECTATQQAAIVDGPTAGEALEACEALGLTLAAVWNTHTHGDHIGVNRDLQRRGLLQGLQVVGFAGRRDDIPGITHPVVDGDTVQLGELTGRVMLTEGHIDGHVSFVVDDVLFCGDTLFAGGCGYLFDGPPSTMFDSLLRLAALPGGTRVCCAHEYTQDNLRFAWSVEPDNAALVQRIRQVWDVREQGGCAVPSTIDDERATNPFLRPGSPTLKAAVAAALPHVDLSTPAAVFAATRQLKDTKAYRQAGDTGLPLAR